MKENSENQVVVDDRWKTFSTYELGLIFDSLVNRKLGYKIDEIQIDFLKNGIENELLSRRNSVEYKRDIKRGEDEVYFNP